jgi:DNA repair photolyase
MTLRDMDVLSDMAKRAGVSVCFSVTTLDNDIWKELEPGTPPPAQRLHVMEQLVKAGVSAGVLLAPIVPGLTDDQESLEAVVEAAAAHGASFLGTKVLHLQQGTKEHFMEYLETQHPRLYHAYQGLYPAEFAPKQIQEEILERVDDLKSTYGLREGERNDMGLPVRECQLELVGV